MALCVLAVVLLSVSVVPALLDRLAVGTGPVMRLAAWLATVITVVGAVFAVPLITAVKGHFVAAAVVTVPLLVLAYRICRRYRGIMIRARDHALAVRLIARSAPGLRAQTSVVTIDSPIPLVYCLSARTDVIVITTGAHDRLTLTEMDSVLAHEEAHLRQRHPHLRAVVQSIAAVVWWLPFFRRAAERITDATELCADAVATRHHHPHTLARALMALAPAPVSAVGAALTGAPERLEHLLHPPQRRHRRHLAMALVAIAPTAALFGMTLGCPLMAGF